MEDLYPRVSQLERLVEHLYAELRLTKPAPDSGVSPRVRELVLAGNTIQAIKAYREETGADLKTANDVVQGLR